ncbi:sulfotransferase family 2 domain-containing protein [Acuticoccus mangrovi]|uniref:Sulfotransferase family 2 domain-containing protein n=1 Tax=Acuticoccus mangrovi TaxID=2796142 RepID=A0A934MEH6_9HYPH|nr:sulfotransferase family 2 domain-containing protein [Acuticoccus mangrovi]MBJ3774388.1 sulfotransferase family 2 domain-containing protein [Acuticoccus mangrovi]
MPYPFHSKKIVVFTSRKVASASIRRLVYKIEAPDTDFRTWRHEGPGATMSSSKFKDVWDGYRKIAIVREPVARLVSCYKHRVAENELLWVTSGPDAEKGRENIIAAGLSPSPTLLEFLRDIDRYAALSPNLAGHLLPQQYFLGPDLSYYSDVIRMEELHKLGDVLGKKVPHLHKTNSEKKLDSEIVDLCDKIAADDIQYLAEYYRQDA